MNEPKILVVAMEAIENIFRIGEKEFINEDGQNLFALEFELCGGVDRLEELQLHKNHQVYEKAIGILETYYATEGMNDAENLVEQIAK